ncbi:anthranilate synthase component I family protein [Nonlabens xiamenensis]|uniref:anthranilate synthase component I family protein n=1 Tax=Nonlabens xiamenensis TaxID=2341043 RepID=UPI000F60876F|nr:anthranilate synthase component I family protein [Nonlabens xiamenensis]
MKKRIAHRFPLKDSVDFKRRLLSYYQQEEYFCMLDSNQAESSYTSHETLIGVGVVDMLVCAAGKAFDALENFRQQHQDWCFGWLGYDLKSELESLTTGGVDNLRFPDLCFFVPKFIFELTASAVKVHAHCSVQEAQSIIDVIQATSAHHHTSGPFEGGNLIARDTREAYLKKAQTFLDHIHRGDIYEANFCTQFYAEKVRLNSLKAFLDLNAVSEPPFAVYARFGDYHVMSASPERYLKKEGNLLVSQPIKGTARRSMAIVEDQALRTELFKDPKERSENVMIVDLVRNDLARIAAKGSVEVEELFGIYSFKQVHQMISTITARLAPEYNAMDAIKASFPMGSMTGAPKISAMKIIEQNESFKRGLYSGAIGYFTPDDDFDFNVVIRTILYNQNLNELAFGVGSALTAAATPEKEYEECLLKAKALIQVLALQGIRFE